MIKYRIFNNSASLMIDGEAFSLSSSHPDFEKIISLAKAQNKEEVLSILNHQELLNIGLELKDGTIYYKQLALPNFFYSKFLKIKTKKDLIPLINTWYNLENKLSLLDKKRFGVYLKDSYLLWDDSGETYLYDSATKIFDNSSFFQTNNTDIFNEISQNYPTVSSYIKTKWSNLTGQLLKEIQRVISSDQKMNLNFLRLGTHFESFSPEESLDVLKKTKLKSNNIDANINLAPIIMSKLSKSQIKKFFHELINHADILTNFRELLTLSPNFEIPDFNTVVELRELINREIKKYDGKEFNLGIDLTNPKLFKLHESIISQELKLIVPLTNSTLVEWGQKLQHCIGGYGKNIAQGRTYCFAIYSRIDNSLLYTIEYNNNRIVQFMGKHNRPAYVSNREHHSQVVEFLKEQELILRNNLYNY